jgi:hypothetical protein
MNWVKKISMASLLSLPTLFVPSLAHGDPAMDLDKSNAEHSQSDPNRATSNAAPTQLLVPPPLDSYYFENITNTFRQTYPLTVITTDPKNPDRAMFGSHWGYVFESNNAGLVWEMGRVAVDRSTFFGNIRRQGTPPDGRLAQKVRAVAIHTRGGGANPVSSKTGRVKRFGPDPTKNIINRSQFNYGSQHITDSNRNINRFDRVEHTGASGGSDSAHINVGLKTAAPYLQDYLRRKGKKPAGMNLQQALFIKGAQPVRIHQIAINPHDTEIVYAGTDFGLYRSNNGGLSWERIFVGQSNFERVVARVTIHPTNPKIIWIGTRQGINVSTDGGESFSRPVGSQISFAGIDWIDIHPKYPENILVGAWQEGVFLSRDGGKNFKWIWGKFVSLPLMRSPTNVRFDPNDPDRFYWTTFDGAFKTTDAGENVSPMGGLYFEGNTVWPERFPQQWTKYLEVNHKYPNRLMVFGTRWLWISDDYGETWKNFYTNNDWFSIRWAAFSQANWDDIWVLTSNQVIRMSPTPIKKPEFDIVKLMHHFEKEVPLKVVVDLVHWNYKLHNWFRYHKRERATAAHLLPKMTAFTGYRNRSVDDQIEDKYYNLPTLYRSEEKDQGFEWSVFLKWDLQKLIYDRDTTNFGRIGSTTGYWRLLTEMEVMRYYEERRRLQIMLLTDPPKDPQKRFIIDLRMQELNSMLNFMTNGAFPGEKKNDSN